jgi:hypothetical protein
MCAVGICRSFRITVFGTYEGALTIVRKVFDWKRSRISMLELEAVLQSCIPQVQIGLSIVLYLLFYIYVYTRSLLLVESFYLRPSNQCILVMVIPSCFRFAKMCLWQ